MPATFRDQANSIRTARRRISDFFGLCKPRVNSLIVFTAMICMLLASPGFPPLTVLLSASIGTALVAGAAAEFRGGVRGEMSRQPTKASALRRSS